MSLSKCLLLRLKSSAPLSDRCQLAKDLCKREIEAFSYTSKVTIVINWLCELIHQEKERWTFTYEIWDTLYSILTDELKIRGSTTSLNIKSSFARTIQWYFKTISETNLDSSVVNLFDKIVNCISVILQFPCSSTTLISNPKTLLVNFALILKYVARLLSVKAVPESTITGLQCIVTHILESNWEHRNLVGIVTSSCLQPFIMFIHETGTLNASNQHHSLQLISEKIRVFLKEILCQAKLNQSYKVALELQLQENSKPRRTNPVEKMFESIKRWLQSKDASVKSSTAGLTVLLLEGFLERPSASSVDLPFSLLIVFTNMYKIFDQNLPLTSNISNLSELLKVCERSSYLHKNCTIPKEKKMFWFHKVLETLLISDIQSSPELFHCLSSLISIYSEIIQQQTEAVWRLILINNVNSNRSEALTQFLGLLLKTFIRLRKVPKLILDLTVAMKATNTLSPSKCHIDSFPDLFLIQFSECITSLPIGQILELGKTLLETHKLFLEDESNTLASKHVKLLAELLSALLTHTKLTPNDIPLVKVDEVKQLMQETLEYLQVSLTKFSKHDFETLSLCYAWGEASLTILIYNVQSNSDLHASLLRSSSNSDPFDLNPLHNYLTAEDWIMCLKQVSENENLSKILLVLLIQKVRYMHISLSSDSEDRKHVTKEVASYILNFVYQKMKETDKQKYGLVSEMWDTVLPWLSLLVPYVDSKLVFKLCKMLSVSLLEENRPNANLTLHLFKSNFFLESRAIQTTLITCLWEQYGTTTNGTKRKFDSTHEVVQNKMFKAISKHPKMWEKYSETMPELSKNENNDMWSKIQETANTFCMSSRDFIQPVNIKTALTIAQTLRLFPLEDLEPGNQMRCLLGIFNILYSINVKITDQETKTQLFVLLCQVLLSLLQKIPSARMALIFDPNLLLKLVIDILQDPLLSEEEGKWTNKLLDKVIFLAITDESSFLKLESFITQLSCDNGDASVELKVLTDIGKRMMVLLKRHMQLSHLESFQVCDHFTKTIVSKLSNKLSTMTNLNHELAWESFHCIFSYHCLRVPINMKCTKRKPKQIFKKHSAIVVSLVAFYDLTEKSWTTNTFLQLVGLICKNRKLISKHLPEDFIHCIWPIFMEHLMSNSHDTNETQEKIQLSTLVLLLKCCELNELATISNEINFKCANMVSNRDIKNILQILTLWTKIIVTDFWNQAPKPLVFGLKDFLNLLMPLLFELSSDSKETTSILQILTFVTHALQKSQQLSLKHGQTLAILQACSSLKLSVREPLESSQICNALIEVYQQLLTRCTKILGCIAPFISCLSVILRLLIGIGNQVKFNSYKDNVKSAILTCTQNFSKLLGLVAKNKTEFSKQVAFMIAEYLSEVQNVTIHCSVKEQLLLGIYKLMDLCDDYSTLMLQRSVSAGGREIFNKLCQEFNQHYQYKGKV